MFIKLCYLYQKEIYPKPKKGVYNEKNIIFILHMFYHFCFCRMQSFSKERFCRGWPQHRKLQQQLPLQKIPLILLPLIHAKNDSYDFSAIKKNQKNSSKKVNNATSSSNASVNENVFTL